MSGQPNPLDVLLDTLYGIENLIDTEMLTRENLAALVRGRLDEGHAALAQVETLVEAARDDALYDIFDDSALYASQKRLAEALAPFVGQPGDDAT